MDHKKTDSSVNGGSTAGFVIQSAAQAQQLSFTLSAGQNVEENYTFNSFIAPVQKNKEKPPVPASIGPDPRNANASLHLAPAPSMDAGNGVLFDFNFGFRVKMPEGNRLYTLRVVDADTQTLIANMTLSGGTMAVGDKKYFIRYHFEVIDNDTNQVIAFHDYNCEEKRVMIIIPDGALGDNLAWMPYADEFRKKYHAKVTCVCGEWLSRIVRNQYPELDFASVANTPESKDFYASYFCAIFPKERSAWRPSDHQNFGMQGTIARILGVEPKPCKLRLPYCAKRPIKEPYVCISTLATNPCKYWNYPDGWNILCRYLKRLGYRVFDIDREYELTFGKVHYTVPSEAEDCTGLKPITERMAMLQHAEFFIGLPSGLSWLAWNCNIPVVMISGFTLDGSEFPTPYRVFNQNFCHGCWNDSNLFFDMHTLVWCPRHAGTPREIECTRVITPKMVIDAVNRIPSVSRRVRPLVTFALPVHNPHLDLFSDALQLVIELAKEYGNAELLIGEDGSIEPAAKYVIEECRRRNPGLVSIVNLDKRATHSQQLQALLERAGGCYFIPVNQDALLLRFELQNIVSRLEEHIEIVCNYGKRWLCSGNGPDGVSQGGPYSPFLSLCCPMQNMDAAVFRTEALRQCGGWSRVVDEGGSSVFSELALHGVCEYTSEVRTLALWQEPGADAISREKLLQLIAPYKEAVLQLEQGIVPAEQKGIPLAALAGAVFALHKEDGKEIGKLLKAVRQSFPGDPGVRRVYLQWFAEEKDMPAFKSEWDAIIHTFLNIEDRCFIFEPFTSNPERETLFSPKQLKALKQLYAMIREVPGAVIETWNSMLAPRQEALAQQIKKVRISVIIPAIRGKYLAECVHSVVQAFAAYGQTEILLYNDASTEPDLDIRMQILKAENPDIIRVFRGTANIGAAMARAELVRHSKGEYIVCFDDDDIMLPFDVKRVVDFLDANLQYCASYAPKYLFNERGYMNEVHGGEYSYFQAFFAPQININGAFIRKSDLIEAGDFQNVRGDKKALGEDIYLFIRMSLKKDLWFDSEARVLYRIHGNQLTHSHPKWEDWITQQPCNMYPELTKRIIAGDIPNPCGEDFRIVRGIMGAVLFFHQQEPEICEPIIQTALKYFPEDIGTVEAALRIFRMQNRMDELLDYYPKALEQFKDTVFPRIIILEHVLAAMQSAKMPLPSGLTQLYQELIRKRLRLSTKAEVFFKCDVQ